MSRQHLVQLVLHRLGLVGILDPHGDAVHGVVHAPDVLRHFGRDEQEIEVVIELAGLENAADDRLLRQRA